MNTDDRRVRVVFELKAPEGNDCGEVLYAQLLAGVIDLFVIAKRIDPDATLTAEAPPGYALGFGTRALAA